MRSLFGHKRLTFAVFFSVITLGISSMIAQITLTRELLNVCGGSELVIGYALSIWLLLTGLGALLAGIRCLRKRAAAAAALSLPAVALLPFAHLILLRILPPLFTAPGAVTGPGRIFALIPLLVLPYCLASGGFFVFACALIPGAHTRQRPGRIYLADTIGDITGGVLYSFGLVFILTTFDSLYIPAVLNLFSASILLAAMGFRKTSATALLSGAAVCLALFCLDADTRTISAMVPAQTIECVKETRYGRIVVTRYREQVTIFENGTPVCSSQNTIQAEQNAHLPLSLITAKKPSVLLISGGLGGSIQELLKYNPERIDYVELDPYIIELGTRLSLRPDHPCLHVHKTDGRLFLQNRTREYDAVILNLPPPETIQLNRFYTREFFAQASAAMKKNGILLFSLPGYANYLSPELRTLYASVHSAARKSFCHSIALPLDETVFLVSDSDCFSPKSGLVPAIARALSQRNIHPLYVNQYYLSGTLTPDRMAQVRNLPDTPANQDLMPYACWLQLQYWLDLFHTDVSLLFILFAGAAILFLILLKPAATVMWSTGFCAAGAEIVLLMLFQIASGYVYFKFGITVTLFMAGLACGGFTANRLARNAQKSRRMIWGLKILELALLACLLCLLALVTATGFWRHDTVLYGFIFTASFISGAQFPFAALLSTADAAGTTSGLYFADLCGSGIGAFVTGLLLLPTVGVPATLLILCLIKIPGLLKLFLKPE